MTRPATPWSPGLPPVADAMSSVADHPSSVNLSWNTTCEYSISDVILVWLRASAAHVGALPPGDQLGGPEHSEMALAPQRPSGRGEVAQRSRCGRRLVVLIRSRL